MQSYSLVRFIRYKQFVREQKKTVFLVFVVIIIITVVAAADVVVVVALPFSQLQKQARHCTNSIMVERS